MNKLSPQIKTEHYSKKQVLHFFSLYKQVNQKKKEYAAFMIVYTDLPIGCVVPFSMAAATARASFSQLGTQQEEK